MSNTIRREKRTAALHNLGCKVNAYETEAMASMLEQAGYEIVPFSGKADVYVINTCTVTNEADRKSRQMLGRARRMNPDAVIAAVGCYVQTHGSAAEQLADIIIGTNRKNNLVPMIERVMQKRSGGGCEPEILVSDMSRPCVYEELPGHLPAERTRAVLKIQDGCNQFCSYCAIPLARGRVRSRDPGDVLREARLLAQAGVREVVLTGIHLCSYGTDFSGPEGEDPLLGLIGEIADIPGLCRIRLGSLEPGYMTDDVIGRMSQIPELCPHFHLSLQSGCDATLARMNRHYTTGRFRHICMRLRECFDTPTLTTDVIVGFPGESSGEFAETRSFLEEIRFYHMHIFKYSKRDGTRAAIMPDQIPADVKTERSRILNSLNDSHREYWREKMNGRRETVLLEEPCGEGWTGHTAGYMKALVKGEEHCKNELFSGIIGKEILLTD